EQHGHLFAELTEGEMGAVHRILDRNECRENVLVMLRVPAMKTVIAHADKRIEDTANFRCRLAGAAVAKQREGAWQACIARYAMGIGGFLKPLESGEDEPRLMRLERP